MIASPLDSALLGPLLSDPETAALFSDDAAIRAMLDFEVALATAQERVGLIPRGSAARIAAAATSLRPDWKRLGRGAAAAGHPVVALVRGLRQAAGPAADYVHRGATAQDVIDSALALRLSAAFDRFDARLASLIDELKRHAERFRNAVMAGRTRMQQAVPITFGLRAAGWLLPLARHRRRLAELRPRTLAVQFGGAAGTLGALGSRGVRVMDELALDLGLEAPPTPWHSQRDGFAEAAGWMALVSGSLAKMGHDICLMAQSEVGEVRDGSAGTSSAMPHKSNPVRSETLVTLGRANANLLATMHQALIHENERSGSAWTLEWLTLPQMAVITGASLRIGLAIAGSLEADQSRMLRNVGRSQDLLLAEAAAVCLAGSRGMAEARRTVAAASRRARESGQGLIGILERETRADMDWEALRDPSRWLGSASALIDRALAAAAQAPARTTHAG